MCTLLYKVSADLTPHLLHPPELSYDHLQTSPLGPASSRFLSLRAQSRAQAPFQILTALRRRGSLGHKAMSTPRSWAIRSPPAALPSPCTQRFRSAESELHHPPRAWASSLWSPTNALRPKRLEAGAAGGLRHTQGPAPVLLSPQGRDPKLSSWQPWSPELPPMMRAPGAVRAQARSHCTDLTRLAGVKK